MGKRMFLKQEIQKIDELTGEIITTQLIKAYKDKKPSESYFKVNVGYINAIISKEITKQEILLYMILGNYMTYENEIVVDNKLAEDIGEIMSIKPKSVKNYLYGLVNKNFIKRINENRYLINPNYIGKGNGTVLENLKIKYNE